MSWKELVESDDHFLPNYIELLALLLDSEADDIIDFGCGHGRHVNMMVAMGKRACGVDHNPPPEALEHAAREGYEIIVGSWDDLEPEKYGAGWSHHVLEHSRDVIGTLHTWGRAIRTGGEMYVAVPRWREDVLAGHVHTGFSPDQLAYLMAVAGWDCRAGMFGQNLVSVLGVATKPAEFRIKDHLCQGINDGSGWAEVQEYLPGAPNGCFWKLPQGVQG